MRLTESLMAEIKTAVTEIVNKRKGKIDKVEYSINLVSPDVTITMVLRDKTDRELLED